MAGIHSPTNGANIRFGWLRRQGENCFECLIQECRVVQKYRQCRLEALKRGVVVGEADGLHVVVSFRPANIAAGLVLAHGENGANGQYEMADSPDLDAAIVATVDAVPEREP
jgi:hypothetical protein